MILSVALLLLTAPALVFEDETEPASDTKARELKVEKGKLPTAKGGLGDPKKITSKEELAKAVSDADAVAAIAKEVDFKKEVVLLFAWSGSGGDKLTMTDKKGAAVFTLKRGLTRDLRMHTKVFALPKKIKYSMGK